MRAASHCASSPPITMTRPRDVYVTVPLGPVTRPSTAAAAALRNDGREIWLAGGRALDGERLNAAYVLYQTPLFDRLLDARP